MSIYNTYEKHFPKTEKKTKANPLTHFVLRTHRNSQVDGFESWRPFVAEQNTESELMKKIYKTA